MFELIIGMITNHEAATSASIITLLILILHLLDKRAIAPYLKGYSEQVGQIRAMKKNFDNLVNQTKELTTITDKIKAEISDEAWDRQRQWELRRDLVIDVIRALGELDKSLIDLHSAYSRPKTDCPEFNAETKIKRKEARDYWDLCHAKYYRAMFLTDLVSGRELIKKLSEYFHQISSIAFQILDENVSYFSSSDTRKKLAELEKVTIEEARKDLNFKINP